MKKMIFLMIVTASLAACQKIKNLANITFNIPFSQTVTVPAVPGDTYGTPIPGGVANLSFPPISIATNSGQYFNEYHASQANIVSAYITQLSVQITAPENADFDLLNNIQVYVSDKSQLETSANEVLVAYDYNIPKGQTLINLNIAQGLNLRNYVASDTITVWITAQVNAVPASGMQVYLSGNFQVTANPL